MTEKALEEVELIPIAWAPPQADDEVSFAECYDMLTIPLNVTLEQVAALIPNHNTGGFITKGALSQWRDEPPTNPRRYEELIAALHTLGLSKSITADFFPDYRDAVRRAKRELRRKAGRDRMAKKATLAQLVEQRTRKGWATEPLLLIAAGFTAS